LGNAKVWSLAWMALPLLYRFADLLTLWSRTRRLSARDRFDLDWTNRLAAKCPRKTVS